MPTDFTLMHKDIPVIDIKISDYAGDICHINKAMHPEHLPVGVNYKRKDGKILINRAGINNWWSGRAIPESRDDIDNFVNVFGTKMPKTMISRTHGLSLTDAYWIKSVGDNISWSDINYFENSFSHDIGDVLFGAAKDAKNVNVDSPDVTTDGCLRKRWQIINNKRCLVKAGNEAFNQQPFNEVIASKIMDRLNIDHTVYDMHYQDGCPYSVCETFADINNEYVSAWRVVQSKPKANHESYYTHYVDICKEHGLENITDDIDRMIVVDYIIANEDRHFNNFGIMRDANTLEWVKAAPIFDSGSSLGYDKISCDIDKNIKCKTFKSTHEKQLALVKSFDWVDFSKLNGVEDDVAEIMSTDNAKAVLGDNRAADIARFVKKRVENLEKYAVQRSKGYVPVNGSRFAEQSGSISVESSYIPSADNEYN